MDVDVVVVGAGFAGIYAAHVFRDRLGLSVQGFESAPGPGGTWYWNRYPGARCDIESVHYSFSFSERLQRGWEWSERYAGQPEILAYLEWSADELDVRRAFRFGSTVTSLHWDEDEARWAVGVDGEHAGTARWVIGCVGPLSVPTVPDIPGLAAFAGEVHRTSTWPAEPVDFRGRRVAVFGTGSSGIQVIPRIAADAEHVTVFQRTPNYAVPLRNEPVPPPRRRWNAEHHGELRAGSRQRFTGVPLEVATRAASEVDAAERRRVYDRHWERGGFSFFVSTFTDLTYDEQANETAAEYVRERIRERVDDPATAELLCPDDHPYGGKRPPFETGYYETFNLAHVDLVDLRTTPVETVTASGVRTPAGEHDVDTIVLATGFDAFTAPVTGLGPVGRGGRALTDEWSDGPVTYLGLQVHGFPNFFMINGPQSSVPFYNAPLAAEDHVDLAAAAVVLARERGARTVEPTAEAQRRWSGLSSGMAEMMLLSRAPTSWFTGGNVPGKPRGAYIFPGGAPLFRAVCDQVERAGMAGFALDGAAEPLPPLVRTDPGSAMALVGMLNRHDPDGGTGVDELVASVVGR